MTPFDLAAALVCLAAVFGVLNHFLLRLPSTIGLVVIALATSLTLMAADRLIPGFQADDIVRREVLEIDFADALLHGMLGFLLFAGALHVDFEALQNQKWVVALMASVGVLISTAVAGSGFHLLTGVPILVALVFGALISPTDPVAVLGLLKQVQVPRSLEAKIAGESLFNDGVAYVLFLIVSGIAFGAMEGGTGRRRRRRPAVRRRSRRRGAPGRRRRLARIPGHATHRRLCARGAPDAGAGNGMLRAGDSHPYQRTNRCRRRRSADRPYGCAARNERADAPLRGCVLAAHRRNHERCREFTRGAVPIMTWGGLRGGISVALVLSLPASEFKPLLLTVTYVIVIFSIIVQGLTMGRLVRRFVPADIGRR